MSESYKKTFYVILAFIFLFPIFFVPSTVLNLAVTKSALFVLGTVVSLGVFLFETWKEGKIEVPWNFFTLAAALLPVIYFLSASITSLPSLSLSGYNFEVGTFGYILISSIMLTLVSIVFKDNSRVLQALAAFLASFVVLALFSTVKILTGLGTGSSGFPVWGTFFSNTDNPIGRWTDLAISFGLLSILLSLILGMIPMKKQLRIAVYFMFALSTGLFVVLNFSVAFTITLVSSIVIFVYFFTVEKHFLNTTSLTSQTSTNFALKPTFLPVMLGALSLIFLINPTISSEKGTLGDVVSRTFNVVNTEVRPSLSATLSVSKAALSKGIFLGSGPNTFSKDWLIYKPANVNTTPFWGVSFPFGIGFIPTQISSTGVLGTILWIVFFATLIILGVRVLGKITESRALRFTLASTFISLSYLWIGSFLYSPSPVVLALAFIFSGLFVAACRQVEVVAMKEIVFSKDTKTNFLSNLSLVAGVVCVLALGFLVFNKTVSAFYFNRAANQANMSEVTFEEVEESLNKALKYSQNDVYYVALSRLHFAQAQATLSSSERSPEENLVIFENAVSKSVAAARSAIALNPSDFQNWIALGRIYGFLVPEPFSVAGAYESAKVAYAEAKHRNPLSPDIPLLLAQLEFYRNDIEAARSLVREAIALKEDYADAYIALAELEIKANNLRGAIESAEALTIILPTNPAMHFGLGMLKYSNQDYQGSVDAFSRALSHAPTYANAQYYLGLSLGKLGRLDEAREQFESLARANPDNAEVLSIIEDLSQGENPF